MKVALKDIKPNPWRHIDSGYPINQEKVKHLQDSIKFNGFWGGLVGRKAKTNGYYEIAFGHHRLEALRKEHPQDHEIELPIRNLSDAQMLQFMATENNTLDTMSPAVINETVKAAMEFLKQDIDTLYENARQSGFNKLGVITSSHLLHPLLQRAKQNKQSSVSLLISEFLRWPISRIDIAINALHAFKKKQVDKSEYETLPTQKIADEFRREIIKTTISKEQRAKIVEKLKKGEIGTKHIKQEILDAKFPLGKPKKTTIDLDDIADQITKRVLEATVLMTPEFMACCGEVSGGSLQRLSRAVNSFIGKLRQVKGKQLLIGGVER